MNEIPVPPEETGEIPQPEVEQLVAMSCLMEAAARERDYRESREVTRRYLAKSAHRHGRFPGAPPPSERTLRGY